MNRVQRRKLGFTESRYRKQDVISNGMNTKIINPFHHYSNESVAIFYDGTPQLTDRLDCKPRKWQVERDRRRGNANLSV